MKYSDEFHLRWFQIENIIHNVLSILKSFIEGLRVDFQPHLKLRTFEHMTWGPIRVYYDSMSDDTAPSSSGNEMIKMETSNAF